jgi:2-polyprenyl-3-methyl-5-hydroxy-6-metoxy-1,4-benzoquinol methylase
MLSLIEKLDRIINVLESHQRNGKQETKVQTPVVQASTKPIESPKPPVRPSGYSDFDKLRVLVKSPSWPAAVDEKLICTTEDHKIDRAEGVVNGIILTPLINKKFLDFGCGDNYIADAAASQGAKLAIGYDPNPEKRNSRVFSDLGQVVEQGPFDVILLYDVVDHLADPNFVFGELSNLCREGTEVYVTCHPTCSRHGSHFYREFNKAFLQIIFTEEELKDFGLNLEQPVQVVDQAYYNALFRRNKLAFRSLDVRSNPVENFFFSSDLVSKRLKSTLGEKDFARQIWKIRNSFYDYVLTYTEKSIPEFPPYVVATYNHFVNNNRQWVQKAYSTGKINDPNAPHTWEIKDDTLLMRWQSKDAPTGFWTDTCTLNENKQSWKGVNQSNVRIEGQII